MNTTKPLAPRARAKTSGALFRRCALAAFASLSLTRCMPLRTTPVSAVKSDDAGGPMRNGYWAAYLSDRPARAACGADQTQTSFTVANVSPRPTLPPALIDPNNLIAGPGERFASTITLELCVSGDDRAELKQVVQKIESAAGPSESSPVQYFTIVLHPQAVVRGLEKALFGDTSELLIVLPYGWGDGFKLAGFGDADSHFAYYGQGKITPDGPEIKNSVVVVGKFEAGEGFGADDPNTCAPPTRMNLSTQEIKTATGKIKIQLQGCVWLSFGTNKILWKKVTVNDSRAPGAAKGKDFLIERGKEPAGSSFDYDTIHHNACTSYVLKLPHAVYALTTLNRPGNTAANLTECGAQVAGAPDTGPVPLNKNSFSVFTYAYTGKPTVTLQEPKITVSSTDL